MVLLAVMLLLGLYVRGCHMVIAALVTFAIIVAVLKKTITTL